MHILVVTQYFWPENFRINDIVAGLHQRGHQVTVLTGHPNYPSGEFSRGYNGSRVLEEQYEGIRVIRVPMLARGQNSGLKLALNYLSFALSGSILGPLLIKNTFDVILVNGLSPVTVGFPGIALKRKSRKPMVYYLQDLWPESLLATGFVTQPVLLRAVSQMVQIIYQACDLILVTSRPFIAKVQGLGYPNEKIRYFPQYAESFYQPKPKNYQWAFSQGLPHGFKVIFAGNMGTAQDMFTVLEAAELTLQDGIHWIFLGDGSVREEMEAKAFERKLSNVHILGSHPGGLMPTFFAQADALLVSLIDDDLAAMTVPAKVQSYLACGRPILASLRGEGAAIIRESGAGLVVAPGQPNALANAARQLKEMSSLHRTQMGHLGRQYFEQHFEREERLSELESYFETLRRPVLERDSDHQPNGLTLKQFQLTSNQRLYLTLRT